MCRKLKVIKVLDKEPSCRSSSESKSPRIDAENQDKRSSETCATFIESHSLHSVFIVGPVPTKSKRNSMEAIIINLCYPALEDISDFEPPVPVFQNYRTCKTAHLCGGRRHRDSRTGSRITGVFKCRRKSQGRKSSEARSERFDVINGYRQSYRWGTFGPETRKWRISSLAISFGYQVIADINSSSVK